jgi:B12-binding domain/radical SAM domain protein
MHNLMKKRRVVFRATRFNRLTIPLLLNIWERNRIDRHFEVIISDRPIPTQKGDVLIYSFMTPHAPLVAEELTQLNRDGVLIAGGGPHINGDVELPLAMGFDVLLQGAGEETFLRFGQDLAKDSIGQSPTIYTSEGNGDFDQYLPFSHYVRTIPPLEIMRGCHWRCKYCQTHNNHIQFRSLQSIQTYLESMHKNNRQRVNFISPSALEFRAPKGRQLSLRHIEQVLQMAASYKFKFLEYGIFPSEVRPDNVTEEAMSLLERYVTNRMITMGAQSGVEHRLKEINRGHHLHTIEEALDIANRHGFFVNLDFIFGYPGETADERSQTLDFIQSAHQRFRVRVQLHHFFPVSGSGYANRFPSYMSDSEKETLLQFKKNGILTNQWQANEAETHHFFQWLEAHHPDIYGTFKSES